MAMAPYQDYRKALADGYRIFLPNLPQPQYHFTNYEYGLEAAFHFDPLKPTSLLYKKTTGRRLQAGRSDVHRSGRRHRRRAKRPNSAEHCALAPARKFLQGADGQKAAYFGPDAKFGLLGSITTKKRVKPQAANFIRTYSDGWSTSIPTRPTRRRSGPPTTTTRATTTWITPPCPA